MICHHLEAITDEEEIDGEIYNRLLINVPPGMMKSLLVAVFWPAWEWGPCNKPWLRYISVSYSADVPERDNLRFARVINHPVYQRCWGDRFKIIREGVALVENDKAGWKRTSSVGGSMTGHRGDRLLLDDLNNPASVESDDVRATTIKFVREIMPDRLNDLERSAIVNIQQRTHQQDATGTLIEFGAGYTFFSIPMEFDPLRICSVVLTRDENGEPELVFTDPRALDEDGRLLEGLTVNARGEPAVEWGSPMAKAEGELCWPERFSEEEVGRLKVQKGAYAWDSQYQQIPGVRGGSIVKREYWRLWTGPYPELGTVIVALDTAIELGEMNDWNACTAWGAFAGEQGEPLLLLLGAWKVRAPLAELVQKVTQTCRERRADYLLIEHKTRGRDVSDEIARLNASVPWETVLIKPQGDKISRLKAVEHLFTGDVERDANSGLFKMTGGIVYAPDLDWAEEVIAQTADFPYGGHDDYVDTVSMALGWTRKNGLILRKAEFLENEEAGRRYRKPARMPYAIRSGR